MGNSQATPVRTNPTIPFTILNPITPKNYTVYVVLGLSFGDEGKGKVMESYLIDKKTNTKAKYSIRFNGGNNAGHTIICSSTDPHLFMTEEKKIEYSGEMVKFATHQLPSGILFGIPGIIGYNCVVNLMELFEEISVIAIQLGRTFQEIADLLTIVPEAHLITPNHVNEDRQNNIVGTTGKGIGPTYAAKALRKGIRIGYYVADPYHYNDMNDITEEIKGLSILSFTNGTIFGIKIKSINNLISSLNDNDVVVMEGAQGYALDNTRGRTYPYVTSSDCTVGTPCSYGFNLTNLIPIGCSKAYKTYVGSLHMEEGFDEKNRLAGKGELLRQLGKECGVTTGRPRQCMMMNLDEEIEALQINQIKEWIINKSDILDRYNILLEKLDTYVRTGMVCGSDEDTILLQQYINDTKDNHQLYCEMIETGAYTLQYKYNILKFNTWNEMRAHITNAVENNSCLPNLERIIWYACAESNVDLVEEPRYRMLAWSMD